MGVIISRFKKKKTTLEVLEELEKNINSIEQYRMNTEQRRRHIVGRLIVYSVGVYVLAAAIFYFYWFPSTLKARLWCSLPLLLFPFIVILLKKTLTFHYSRKITRNEQKLCDLRAEKKKILEDVMDKETYKVARTILEKFAPDQLRSKGLEVAKTPEKPGQHTPGHKPLLQTPSVAAMRSGLPSGLATTELRRRTLPSTLARAPGAGGPPSSLSAESIASNPAAVNNVYGTPMPMHRPSINGQGFSTDFRPPGIPLPRPVLPRERTYLDRVVEYLVGDGPSNRFALICKACDSHNGMALKEEFEYLAFRCSYCHYWNPARKQRPQAPRLTPTPVQSQSQLGAGSRPSQVNMPTRNDDTSDSEKYSGTDSDEDSGPELQPLDSEPLNENQGQGDTDSLGGGEEGESSLDKEADEFLRSLKKDTGKDSSDAESKESVGEGS